MRLRGLPMATIVQLALVAIIGGGLLVIAGVARHTPPPAPVQTVRPATEQERQQWELDRLEDLLRAQQRTGASPSSGPAVPDR